MDNKFYSRFKVTSFFGLKRGINFFYISKPNQIAESLKRDLCVELNQLTKRSWGEFGLSFINDHVISSKFLIIATKDEKVIAYASMSEKYFSSNKYYYFEFLVVDPDYQNIGLSKEITSVFFRKLFFKQFFTARINFNMITITPNPKVVGMIFRRSSWMYPNPLKFDGKKIELPDSETWHVASEVLKSSYNPNRVLEKEGFVLNNSYDSTPWLIYDPETVPQDFDDRINRFCNHYLQYDKKRGKEFIIIAKINLLYCLL